MPIFDFFELRAFEKKLAQKNMIAKTTAELNRNVVVLTKQRDGYMEKAKDALRKGNESLYNTYVALLKNSMVNLAQAEDMVANFAMAKDMYQMQEMNKMFVKSFDKVMKDVAHISKSIQVKTSERLFQKALFQQNQTATELKQALQNNNLSFANSVSMVSDVNDDEIKQLLLTGIKGDTKNREAELAEMEQAFLAGKSAEEKHSKNKRKELIQLDGISNAPERGTARNATEIAQRSDKPTAARKEDKPPVSPEDAALSGENEGKELSEFKFNWDDLPSIGFDDIAGLEDIKKTVDVKVLLPLRNPQAYEGYEKKSGGGLCLYGPPGTGKTMIAAAIANEIGAKFCSVKPSDLLHQGAGNTEKAVKALFAQARKFPCAVIYFDEMDSISPKSTKSQYARQLRSEFLSQLQGIESYGKESDNILFLICATNKPWDIDSAFLRPGRFGTKVYVGLPDAPARRYMIEKRLSKIRQKGIVEIRRDIDVDAVVERTNGFNGSDITNLLDHIEDISIERNTIVGEKYIEGKDFEEALQNIHSSVQSEDIVKLLDWRSANDS